MMLVEHGNTTIILGALAISLLTFTVSPLNPTQVKKKNYCSMDNLVTNTLLSLMNRLVPTILTSK
jgi:hypothetical protein